MADIFHPTPSLDLRGKARAVLARIARALDTYAEARARSAEIHRLLALPDAELAARGLSRDRIVAHVFRDRMGY